MIILKIMCFVIVLMMLFAALLALLDIIDTMIKNRYIQSLVKFVVGFSLCASLTGSYHFAEQDAIKSSAKQILIGESHIEAYWNKDGVVDYREVAPNAKP